ncbi:hypothetical protein JTB14_020334 [Gonioctena quinquepunctata]|nr:hypothetical protein JTB14_020334 [Gonioctena quinquepunctata]
MEKYPVDVEQFEREANNLQQEEDNLQQEEDLKGRKIVLENDIDIMLLSETWLGPDDQSGVVDIPGYTLFRVGRGGGVGA